jgi:5-formyltetrahydrofolate cyclo-ligase
MASGALLSALRSHHKTLSHSIKCITRSMASSEAPIAQNKKAARQAAMAALRKMTSSEMAEESARISKHLESTGILNKPETLAIYVHCAKLREVDTTTTLVDALRSESKVVYVPRVLDKDSNMHFLRITSFDELEEVPPYGIKEPTITYSDGRPREDIFDLSGPELELVIMPGLAFDNQGKRLGRGGGYYDKFIAQCKERAEEKKWKKSPLLVALAFKPQIFPTVPCDPHDQPVDMLITADGVHYLTERAREVEK